MGVSLKNLGKFDEALASYKKAMTLDHNVKLAYENLELLLLNKLKTAVKLAESV